MSVSKEQDKKEEEQGKPPGRFGSAMRKLAAVVVVALVAFVSFDAYFNRWGTLRKILYRKTLQLQSMDGSTWRLHAGGDVEVFRVDNAALLAVPESLRVIDSTYRAQGRYRMYFRISDTTSTRLQGLYQSMLAHDSAGGMRTSVAKAYRSYESLKNLMHIERTLEGDTVLASRGDSVRERSKFAIGSDEEVKQAVTHILKNPQVFVGIGLGLAATAGVETLGGTGYVATAAEDVFRIRNLQTGVRSGLWEGKAIDILWAFSRPDTSAAGRKSARSK